MPFDTPIDLTVFASANFAALVGMVLSVAYCMLAAHQISRDWEPIMGRRAHRPMGLSAATLRWVRSGRLDSASLTAAVLALAAKGAIEVAIEPQYVRLYKTAKSKKRQTHAEAVFSSGLLRLYSSILLTENAGAALRRGAAALQNGIESEWRAFQAGRFRVIFRPAVVIGGVTILTVTALSATPMSMAVRTLIATGGVYLAILFSGAARDSLARIWSEPLWYCAQLAFYFLAVVATLGITWIAVTFQDTAQQSLAAIGAGLALAVPLCAREEAVRGRWSAGPLLGQIAALRSELRGRVSGVDILAFQHDFLPPEREDNKDTPSGAPDSTLEDDHLFSWLPDAVALDAMPISQTAQVASLSKGFEHPERLALVLRAAATANKHNQGDELDAPRAITAQN